MNAATATVTLEGRTVAITLPVRVVKYVNAGNTPDTNNAAEVLAEAARMALTALSKEKK